MSRMADDGWSVVYVSLWALMVDNYLTLTWFCDIPTWATMTLKKEKAWSTSPSWNLLKNTNRNCYVNHSAVDSLQLGTGNQQAWHLQTSGPSNNLVPPFNQHWSQFPIIHCHHLYYHHDHYQCRHRHHWSLSSQPLWVSLYLYPLLLRSFVALSARPLLRIISTSSKTWLCQDPASARINGTNMNDRTISSIMDGYTIGLWA